MICERKTTNMDGIVLIDKKEKITTTDCDYKCKRTFNTSKVGHAGTLDPFATGLVICGINKGTKLLSYLENEIKSYRATLKLGIKTDSGDLDGESIEEKEPSKHTEQEILDVLNSLIGKQKQIPPMYSALKLNGKPLYKYARQGIEVERKEREIEIYSLKLISYTDNLIIFDAVVSKGTYIRTLGETVAEKLNEVGHLIALRRLSVGNISVEKACPFDELSQDKIISLKDAFPGKKIIVKNELFKKAINGAKLELDEKEDLIFLLDENEKEIAIYKRDGETNTFRCEKGFM